MEENFENGIVCRNGESVQALDTITSTVDNNSQGVEGIVAETTLPESLVPEIRNLPKIESAKILFEMDIFDLEALYCQYFPDFEPHIFRFYKRRRMQKDLGIITPEKFGSSMKEAFDKARVFFVDNLSGINSERRNKKIKNSNLEKGRPTLNAANLDISSKNFTYILGARFATFTEATVNSPKQINSLETERPEIMSNLEAAVSTVKGEEVKASSIRDGGRKKIEVHSAEMSWRLHFDTKGCRNIPLDHINLEDQDGVVSFLKGVFEWRGRYEKGNTSFVVGENWPDSLRTDFIRVCATVGIYGALKPRGVIISNITSLKRILELSIISEENRGETFHLLQERLDQGKSKETPIEHYLDYQERRLKERDKKVEYWASKYGVKRLAIYNWLNKKELSATLKTYVEKVETPDPVWEERVAIGKCLRLARQINDSAEVELTTENRQFFVEHAHRILGNQDEELKLNWLAEIELGMAIKKLQDSQKFDPKLSRYFSDPGLVIPDFPVIKTKAELIFNKSYFENLILWMVGEYYSNLNVDLSEIESVALEALEKILPNIDPSLIKAEMPWRVAADEVRESIVVFIDKEVSKNP